MHRPLTFDQLIVTSQSMNGGIYVGIAAKSSELSEGCK